MHKQLDTLTFNGINLSALSFSFIDVESMLTILVLLTALIYNIKKIKND